MSATSHPTEGPESRDQIWREWLAIGVGLTAIMSVIAVILALVAIANGSTAPTQVVAAVPGSAAAAQVAAAPKVTTVKMSFKADDEHGRKGPHGIWHDAGSPANFTVTAGERVTVEAYNYDTAPHSFTAPVMGVNAILAKGSDKQPTETTFHFTAPAKPGRYPWWCVFPCDPWAMTHVGYMRGYVTVKA